MAKEENKEKETFEKFVKDKIVGQELAISTIGKLLRRKELGWLDVNHPLVLLFLGSTGVGKTELAKQVADYLHPNDSDGFIRIDMSELQERHSESKLIGSPPGYIGSNEKPKLLRKLRKFPNAVVLFDEVEKAHRKVLTILIQLFDEGRLIDSSGNSIECKDAIYIMTSNLAGELIKDATFKWRREKELNKNDLENMNQKLDDNSDQTPLLSNDNNTNNSENDNDDDFNVKSKKFKDKYVLPILKSHFRLDEFLGRIKETVIFLPLTNDDIKLFVSRELEVWKSRAKNNHSMDLNWDDSVVDFMCKITDSRYGARSIKLDIEKNVIEKISELHFIHLHAKFINLHVLNDIINVDMNID